MGGGGIPYTRYYIILYTVRATKNYMDEAAHCKTNSIFEMKGGGGIPYTRYYIILYTVLAEKNEVSLRKYFPSFPKKSSSLT